MAVTLLMTSTIQPPVDSFCLKRSDPSTRLNDYCAALKFYLSLPRTCLDRLLFVDNSGADLSPLVKLAQESDHHVETEFISFDGNDFPPVYGRGYGELKLLDHAIAHSKIVQPTDSIWKVTGRLRVLNLPRLIASAPADYSVYCDLRDIPLVGDLFYANRCMDCRLYAFKRADYESIFFDRYQVMREDLLNRSSEFFLFQYMLGIRNRKKIIPRFRVQPVYAGFAGYDNTDYERKYRYSRKVRAVARRIVPWLWI